MISNKLTNYNNFQIGILLRGRADLLDINAGLQLLAAPRRLTLIHADRVNNIEELAAWREGKDIRYNLYGENFRLEDTGILLPQTRKCCLKINLNRRKKC